MAMTGSYNHQVCMFLHTALVHIKPLITQFLFFLVMRVKITLYPVFSEQKYAFFSRSVHLAVLAQLVLIALLKYQVYVQEPLECA